MKKQNKIKWVKQNSPLHKQLTNAYQTGFIEGIRDLSDFLHDEGGFSKEFIQFLIEEEFRRKNKDKFHKFEL